MRVLLTYNPTAGDDGLDPRELVAELEASGHDVAAQSVKEEHWERRLGDPLDLVVVAGGDGTVAKVFKQLAGRSVAAAVVPVGSANNIARSLGYDDVRGQLIGVGRTRFDICSLTWNGGSERFVESAGGGVFAETVARAEGSEAEAGGEDKVVLGLRRLGDVATDVRAAPWRLDADGADLSGEFVAVEVMNARLLGPNVPLAPEADPGDGLLDLVLVRRADAAALAAYAQARLEDRGATPLRLERHRARRIVLEAPDGWPIRVDDDLLAGVRGPLTAAVESTLDVVVP